jgi:O-methyltransferase
MTEPRGLHENHATDPYLELIKRCLMNSIYEDPGKQVAVWSPKMEKLIRSRSRIARALVAVFGPIWVHMLRPKPFDAAIREDGRDWPSVAHTMIGRKRLDNIEFCVKDVLKRGVQGDLIETGVWRGGAVIFMRAILNAYKVADRSVWAADSFEGLPRPNAKKYTADAHDKFHTHTELAVSLDEVRENFLRYGLLDDQVKFLKGWFRDTLPTAPIERVAVMRLDGDMYESTMDALVHLYAKLSVGGYVIIDDYNALPACKEAVHDYRRSQNITEEMKPIDWGAVYWRRSSE